MIYIIVTELLGTIMKTRLMAAFCAGLLMATLLPAAAQADSRSGSVVQCPAGLQVAAYSRADGATWQRHTYYSSSGGSSSSYRQSYIHASESPYQKASTLWEANATINVWSNSCL